MKLAINRDQTNYSTYMRILISASDDVMRANLKYSLGSESKKNYERS